tara:strand:+ start:245 stop:2239 length:1995 start_codon:yes stop_codon:yes gene_type:complete
MIIVLVPNSYADTPEWVKNTAGWWASDAISETEFVNAIEFLIKSGIISISEISDGCEFEDNTLKMSNEWYEKFKHLPDIGKLILCQNIDLTFMDELTYSEKTEDSIRLNQYGFRGPEISIQKPDDTYRVFIVGSSVAFGQHVLEENTISSHLQDSFDAHELEKKIEIINAGFGDAWSKTETKWIKENVSKFEPDLIIVLDGWTDVTRELVKNGSWSEDANLENWISRWNNLCEFGKENGFDTIITVQPILGSSNKMFTNQEWMEFRHHVYQEPHIELLKKYADNLYKLKSSCEETSDLTNIYKGYFFPIYSDLGHVNSLGGKIISDEIFKLSVPIIFDDKSIQEKLLKDINQSKFGIANEIILENDFSGMIISNKKFDSVDNHRFWLTEFESVDFSNMKSSNSDFRIVGMNNVNFRDSSLTDVQIVRTTIVNADFSNTVLTNVKFSSSDIIDSNFNKSVLDNIENYGAIYRGSDFSDSIIKNTTFKRTMLYNNDFSNTKFENVEMESLMLAGSKFSKIDFSSINIKKGTDFTAKIMKDDSVTRGTILDNSDFRNSNVKNMFFSHLTVDDNPSELTIQELEMYRENFAVNASNSNFSDLDLSNKNFIAVKLQFVDLSNSNLSNVDFRYADLSNANLEGANLEGANLEGANLEGANLECINHYKCE